MFHKLKSLCDRLLPARFQPIVAGMLALVMVVTSTLLALSPSNGQALTGAPADARFKFSTPLPPGLASPDKVETRFGTLNFFDGFPDKPSSEKLFDNLDFQRAVQAYLLAIPAVSQAADRNAIRTLGPVNTVVPIWNWWIRVPSDLRLTTTPFIAGLGWI